MPKVIVVGLSVLLMAVVVAPVQAEISLPFDASDLFATGCSGAAVSVDDILISPLSVTCSADCGSHAPVSCTGSGTCTAVDRDCGVWQRGYVECNGLRTLCSPGCYCQDGDIRYVNTSSCCKEGLRKKSYQWCVDGRWVHKYYSCLPDNYCILS